MKQEGIKASTPQPLEHILNFCESSRLNFYDYNYLDLEFLAIFVPFKGIQIMDRIKFVTLLVYEPP